MKEMNNRMRFPKLHIMFIIIIFLITIPDNLSEAKMNLMSNYSLATTQSKRIKNKEEQILAVRLAMVTRKPKLELYYKGNADNLVMDLGELLQKVLGIDYNTTTNDGDYLGNIYNGYSVEVQQNYRETLCIYQFSYSETKKQTDKVNQEVKKVLKELDISSQSTYNKVKMIHDYIVNNTVYDIKGTQNTAYSALFNKKSQCQGYALLTYKMLMEAGVPTKIITGSGGGEPHAWNIVKLGKVWYNLDCTWDDPVDSNGENILVYDYFLKNEKDFINHTRDSKYKTKNFNKKYPMANSSFVME